MPSQMATIAFRLDVGVLSKVLPALSLHNNEMKYKKPQYTNTAVTVTESTSTVTCSMLHTNGSNRALAVSL